MVGFVFILWGCRAVPQLWRSPILPRVHEELNGQALQRKRLDNRMRAEVPDACTLNLRSSVHASGTSDSMKASRQIYCGATGESSVRSRHWEDANPTCGDQRTSRCSVHAGYAPVAGAARWRRDAELYR